MGAAVLEPFFRFVESSYPKTANFLTQGLIPTELRHLRRCFRSFSLSGCLAVPWIGGGVSHVHFFFGDKTRITIPLPIRIITIVVLMFVSGFVNIGQFDKQSAMDGGFTTVEEYKAASAESIKTNEA